MCWSDWICWLWQLVPRMWKMIHWTIPCLSQMLLTPILPMNASNASVTPVTISCECLPFLFTHVNTIITLLIWFLVGISFIEHVFGLCLDYNVSHPNSNQPTGLFAPLWNAQPTSWLAKPFPQIPAIAQPAPILVIDSTISLQKL